MKYCPFCGAGLDEGFAFCPKCGKPFEGEKENLNLVGKCVSQEGFAPAADALLSAAEDTSKKKKRGGLIAIIAAVVVLAFVGGMLAAGAFGQERKAAIPFSDDTEAIAQASKSVVMLTCYDKDGEPCATGSGFAVFDDGIIVTNYHVIEQDTYRVKAQVEGGISFDCPTVLAYDAEKDIAILKADRKTDVALLSAGSANNLQKGEKVVAIGSPLGLINSVSTGVFSGYIDDKAGSVLQFTAAISHGSSGGALFNDAGEVIGITFASLTDGQNLNLAVPIDDVKVIYDNAGNQDTMSIEAFYDTFEHTPPIPTYTVGYVLEHYKELDGQMMYLEGYVSSVSYRAYMVSSPEEVLGYVADFSGEDWGDYYELATEEEPRTAKYQNVVMPIPSEIDFDIEPGQKLSVLCLFEIKSQLETGYKPVEGERLRFTPYEITLLENN